MSRLTRHILSGRFSGGSIYTCKQIMLSVVITMLALLPFTELDDSSKEVECFKAMYTYKNNHMHPFTDIIIIILLKCFIFCN